MDEQPALKPPFDTLHDWLAWQETLNPAGIELGLDRVREVAQRLNLLRTAIAPFVISLAGTNGKGSSAALLEQTLIRAGHRVGVYSSPHLLRYNERLRIDSQAVEDSALCAAFSAVEAARNGVALTYFEFGTLAILWLIKEATVDVAILEVGLGGRLDAVNIIDADLALITNVGLDHQDWLGTDREQIATEKAGIMRPGKPAVYAEADGPQAIAKAAASVGAQLISLAVDYDYQPEGSLAEQGWHWRGLGEQYRGLPEPGIAGAHFLQNAAGVLAALQLSRENCIWAIEDFKAALKQWQLPGRCETRNDQPFGLLLDVAHNAEAVQELASMLQAKPCNGRTIALFAALKDKPVDSMLKSMTGVVDAWHFAGLSTARGLQAEQLQAVAGQQGISGEAFGSVSEAWQVLSANTCPQDRLIVFGSFYTVEAVLRELG